MDVKIARPEGRINCTISLSGSKSISNRVLIIKAISGLDFVIENLSESQDTSLLSDALLKLSEGKEINVNHAGTSFRFLTALLSEKKGEFTLTGSERLKQRPVGELVEVLNQLGASIRYKENNGFPPLEISGRKLSGGEVTIRGDISSQFITALLLIAPTFENGLKVTITTPLVSRPYVEMTVSIMKEFGISVDFSADRITVYPGEYSYSKDFYTVEGDWSSAGYWYEIAALADNSEIILENLFKKSSQADKIVSEIYLKFGVETKWENDQLTISKSVPQPSETSVDLDFTEFPDLAQTVSATCAALGIEGKFKGLQTLKIKETDRISALETELGKLGIYVKSTGSTLEQKGKIDKKGTIETYHDHRMALSFAPLALVTGEIIVSDKNVTEKSYPAFWSDLKKAGFIITDSEN